MRLCSFVLFSWGNGKKVNSLFSVLLVGYCGAFFLSGVCASGGRGVGWTLSKVSFVLVMDV